MPDDPAPGAPDPSTAVTVARLRAEIVARDAVIATLEARISQLDAHVVELEARLRANSSNSSKPPSADGLAKGPPKPNRAARRAAAARRKPGGQPGAPGAHLAQVEHPDVIVMHAPRRCGRCGGELADAPMVGAEARQVHDLPQLGLLVTEHRAERRRCACGTVTAATFPDGVRAPACYGPGVRAAVAYLHGQQHLPVQRTAQALADLVGAEVATGTVAAILAECADGLDGFIQAVRSQLAAAPVAHFDETGARVAGRLHWLHSASTDRLSLFTVHPKRGRQAMDQAGVLPGFQGVAVHDGWSPYTCYQQATHARCNAHHLRELAGIGEMTGQGWPTALADLLVEIHVWVQLAKANGEPSLGNQQLGSFSARYDTLVVEGQQLNPPPPRTGKRGRPRLGPAAALLARLVAHREDGLRVATDFRVAFDNNQAERDVRMVKLQQKISGGWRSETGATAFLAVRSYLSTARKHGEHP
ncbi:MAG: IS66 family transposase, partial [Acidimicrobiales bacterium]